MVVTDPYAGESGLRFPRTLEPEVLVLSHQDKKRFNVEGVLGQPFVINEPGEYEIADFFVRGIQDPEVEKETQGSIIYRFNAEEMCAAFLGQLNRQLTNYELEQLGEIDILFVPVGGGPVLDAKGAAGVIKAVDPRVVIPIYFKTPGVKEKLNDIEPFCKELGVCVRENTSKLKILKKDLPAEDMMIYVLDRA